MTTPSLPRRHGLAYAAGDVGPSLTSLCLAFYWLYFLIDVAHLPALHAGLVHGSGYAVSAAANLWAGSLLERRVRTPAGRARVVAVLGAALAGCFVLLWVVPGAGRWHTAWYLALSWLFHLLFALVYLAYLSLTPLLARAAQQRVDLNAWRFAGSMLLTLAVLGLHGATADAWPLAQRLLALGALVGLLAAAGSIACGTVLGRALATARLPRGDTPAPWRALAAAAPLRRALGINLAVWWMVQSACVLTIFLCRAAAVPDARVLLLMQGAIIVAAAATGGASRRLGQDGVLAGAALLWCAGALCWWGALAPHGAAILLGLGLGAATVVSWARVPEAIEAFVQATGGHADARVYAALTVLRDLVSALVPVLATAALGERAGAGAGAAAALLLGATGLGTALAVAALMRRRRVPALPAGGGTAAPPT